MNSKFFFNFAVNAQKKKRDLKSNLQKSILAFYRETLKFCNSKPEVKPWNKYQIFKVILKKKPAKGNLLKYVKTDFRKNVSLPKNKFNTVIIEKYFLVYFNF